MGFLYVLPAILLYAVTAFLSLYELPVGQTVIASYTLGEGAELQEPVIEEYIPGYYSELAEDRERHEWMWSQFLRISDTKFIVEHVSGFAIFVDTKEEDQLAYVIQDWNDPTKWIVSFDIEDARNEGLFYQTVVHELAHLVTLASDEVPIANAVFRTYRDNSVYKQRYDYAVANCATYFTGEGCANEDSYIYTFVQTFWFELIDTYGLVDTNYADMNFSIGRDDDFVSWYAGTNPGEDIAESFMFFVFRPKPQGDSIATAKQNFFYQYPELVQLRENIRTYLGDTRLRISLKSNKE